MSRMAGPRLHWRAEVSTACEWPHLHSPGEWGCGGQLGCVQSAPSFSGVYRGTERCPVCVTLSKPHYRGGRLGEPPPGPNLPASPLLWAMKAEGGGQGRAGSLSCHGKRLTWKPERFACRTVSSHTPGGLWTKILLSRDNVKTTKFSLRLNISPAWPSPAQTPGSAPEHVEDSTCVQPSGQPAGWPY